MVTCDADERFFERKGKKNLAPTLNASCFCMVNGDRFDHFHLLTKLFVLVRCIGYCDVLFGCWGFFFFFFFFFCDVLLVQESTGTAPDRVETLSKLTKLKSTSVMTESVHFGGFFFVLFFFFFFFLFGFFFVCSVFCSTRFFFPIFLCTGFWIP
jgi:hypothetical protein